VCRYHGEQALRVIDVRSIVSVVTMPPFPLKPEEIANNADGKYDNLYFVGHKIGLEVLHDAGAVEEMEGGAEQGDTDEDI
jgi:hypothetical protein